MSAARYPCLPPSPVERLGPWFHNIHLPDGTQTAPNHFLGDYPSYKWDLLAPHLPRDLRGWRVLDIGCNAGFFTIQLAQRGAQVLGIDHDPRYLEQAQWVVHQFHMEDRVTLRNMQVYDLARLGQSFDIVLFMVVFYHLRYPQLALDIVSRVTADTLVFQTLMREDDEVFEPADDYEFAERDVLGTPGWPMMSFIEKSFSHDPTNWWVPNKAAVLAQLRCSGLVLSHWLDPDIAICRPSDRPREAFFPGNLHELEAALGLPRPNA